LRLTQIHSGARAAPTPVGAGSIIDNRKDVRFVPKSSIWAMDGMYGAAHVAVIKLGEGVSSWQKF
jgi:hypothetical protein